MSTDRAAPVRVRAPAKVNLALHVGARRADGFHRLATVYQAVDLYDELVATPRADEVVSVETRDPAGRTVPGIPDDDTNLAVRAARALRLQIGVRAGARLRVRKRIPVAGGLAGGSADAAAALVGCVALWQADLDRAELLGVAAELGSDVPFALLGGTALGTGRGERVDPLPAAGSTTWLAVSSAAGLPTPAVYAEHGRRHDPPRSGRRRPADPALGEPRVGTALLDGLARGDLDAVAHGLHNDLQADAVALRPELAALLDAGPRAGALATLVSGSGPTVLLLVRDDAHAGAVAAALRSQVPAVLTGAELRTLHGPVPGPLGAR